MSDLRYESADVIEMSNSDLPRRGDRRRGVGRRESDSIIEQLADGVVVVDPEGRIRFLNGTAQRLLGVSGALALGAPFPLGLPSDGRTEIDAREETGASRRLEIRTVALHWEESPAVLVMLRDISGQRDAEEKLRRALVETITTLARTIGQRDPYTAGHQNRTAQLAVAISRELGWASDRQLAIEMSAVVHDVGKVHIPSEILTKPGKLSTEEYELIKTHSLVGYSILRDADLPWPVANIARSHHERLDGSGYPDGLKDDAIPVEALVVAVADVVEAMSADRPYRTGKGVEAGLEEIESGRGSRYDPDAVDACLMLFRKKRFEWA